MSNETSSTNAYQQAKARGQQILYESVMQLASNIVAEEGAEALSMRRLAQLAGCSTTVLYNLFGAKQGIIEALFLEGFQRLREAHAALPVDQDARQHIMALCRVYRQVALAYPTHYAIMFGNVVPDFKPSPEARTTALASMQPLMQAIQTAHERGQLTVERVDDLGMMVWSAAHGFVSLELAEMVLAPERAEALYIAAIERLLG